MINQSLQVEIDLLVLLGTACELVDEVRAVTVALDEFGGSLLTAAWQVTLGADVRLNGHSCLTLQALIIQKE